MTQLLANALAMVNGSAGEVRSALADYQETRPRMLTEEFGGYEVRAGGRGAGTEVHWTLALHEAIRNRKGRKPKKQKQPPRDCLVRVEEPDDDRIVERDTLSCMVTTWTVQQADDGRSAVQVCAIWDGPDGVGAIMARSKEQLAVRSIYEGMLTKLHDLFEAPPPEPPHTPEPESEDTP